MDKQQHQRNLTELFSLIDSWNVCPYQDPIDDFFASLKVCTEAYMKSNDLTMPTIVNIIKDLQTLLNPHENKNLIYFTDIICDKILMSHYGYTSEEFGSIESIIDACYDRVYLKL